MSVKNAHICGYNSFLTSEFGIERGSNNYFVAPVVRTRKHIGSVLVASLIFIYRGNCGGLEGAILNQLFEFVPGKLVHKKRPRLFARLILEFSARNFGVAFGVDSRYIGKNVSIQTFICGRRLRPVGGDFGNSPLLFLEERSSVFVDNHIGVVPRRFQNVLNESIA